MKEIYKNQYQCIIAYGIGQNYFQTKDRLQNVTINYLMDQRWEKTDDVEFQGIPIIRSSEIDCEKKTLFIVFPSSEGVLNYIKRTYKCDACHIYDLIPMAKCVTGEQLRDAEGNNRYDDENGNIIEYDEYIPRSIKIYFYGSNNRIKIGKNICINGYLHVSCGNNGVLSIGDNTTIISAEIHLSQASIHIGKDCMLSRDIRIRNNDNHHIFSLLTGNRINNSKDVVIGNQVWICRGAVLLAGASIGNGSIVGENAITSSSFPDHVIIAGSPARIIREGICWSRDYTFCFERERLEDCIDQSARRYL